MRFPRLSVRTGLAAAIAVLGLVAVIAVRTPADLPRGAPPQASAPAAPAAPGSDVASAEPPVPPGVEVVPEAESPPPIQIRQSGRPRPARAQPREKDPLRH